MLPESGPAYIWCVNRPDQRGVGPCLCDLMGYDESYPLSEGLFWKFNDWAMSLDHEIADCGYTGEVGDDWNWPSFHARGLQLSRWLKEEVGDAFRVVYHKPTEDPDWRIHERTEILANGSQVAWQR